MTHLRQSSISLLICLIVLATHAAGFAAEMVELPPVAAWGPSTEVDEPESAFHSLGRTRWHQRRLAGRSAGRSARS